MHEVVAALAGRLGELERRVSNMLRPGNVAEVNGGKVRMKIGGTEDAPFLSPWVPYSQIAGAMKVHTPPSVGQQMTLLSVAGDYRQALAVPMTWSNDNQAPSDKLDEHVMTFGEATFTLKGESLEMKVGDFVLTLTKDAMELKHGDASLTVSEGAITATVGGHGWSLGSSGMTWDTKATFKNGAQPVNGNPEVLA